MNISVPIDQNTEIKPAEVRRILKQIKESHELKPESMLPCGLTFGEFASRYVHERYMITCTAEDRPQLGDHARNVMDDYDHNRKKETPKLRQRRRQRKTKNNKMHTAGQ